MAGGQSMRSGVLVGRRRELAVLDRLVADVAAGSSRVLVIRGEAGVGKSALLGHLAARVPGWRVVSAVGVESETVLAHSGLHELCTPLLDRSRALPAPQRDALTTALGLSAGPAPDPLLVALAALSLVTEAAAHHPLACLVDDAQWLDRASARVLGFIGRRLGSERVALACAVRTDSGDDVLRGAPVLTVQGLSHVDARALLLRDLHVPLDPAVTDRIVAESRGNPRALLEVARTSTAAALAGGFGLPETGPLGGGTEAGHVQRLALLPADTRLLVLAAAADPVGDLALLHRAAGMLGIDTAAFGPAVDSGLLRVGRRVVLADPFARSAVYRAAAGGDRRRVHAALAEATDVDADPDRRAWHRARAVLGPDEAVAADLERSADQASARAGLAAGAAFLTRAAELTPDRRRRVQRALHAAAISTQAGALDTARTLLDIVREGPFDEMQHARADLVGAQLALVSGQGHEAVPLLLSAARQLQAREPDLARAMYLDAFSATHFAARLLDGVVLADLVAAACSALRRPNGGPTVEDLLLMAFAALTEDHAAAVQVGRQALAGLRGKSVSTGNRVRRLWQGSVLALELWDDEAAYALADEHLHTVHRTGALGELPLALGSTVRVLVLGGELPAAAALIEEARSVQEAAGGTVPAYGALTHAAWRGQQRQTLDLVEMATREARARREGIGIAVCAYARAVLFNGLGRHEEALGAARVACTEPHEVIFHNGGLSELVESAARAGHVDLATDALRRLTARTQVSGTDWAQGMEARARALLSGASAAEDAYRQAIEHLGRARFPVELARAHLLYGEWLHQDDRRTAARDELSTAYEMFAAMGLEAFEERTRRALVAAGVTVGTRAGDARGDLTPQEAHIAVLARDGSSNAEIGAQLFLSARTVEWHLRKVFTKLGIRSRRELRRALADHEGPDTRPRL